MQASLKPFLRPAAVIGRGMYPWVTLGLGVGEHALFDRINSSRQTFSLSPFSSNLSMTPVPVNFADTFRAGALQEK